jgi:hypothetical protein
MTTLLLLDAALIALAASTLALAVRISRAVGPDRL